MCVILCPPVMTVTPALMAEFVSSVTLVSCLEEIRGPIIEEGLEGEPIRFSMLRALAFSFSRIWGRMLLWMIMRVAATQVWPEAWMVGLVL